LAIIDCYTLLGAWPQAEVDLSIEALASGMQARSVSRSLVTHTAAIFYDASVGNSQAVEACAQHDPLTPVAVINPLEYPDCLDEVNRCLEKGIVVFLCDNRTASGKGAASAWPAYKRLGASELADIEDGVAWLKQQRWVDPARIGIGGWSYGGFMTSYALTHSRSFAMGIAGGSVTDWRDYDSVYTERYMRTPQNNPDGYRDTAPRLSAKELHGKLLLIHGSLDDNVHPQNTLQFAYELQRAGKPFRMMLYPKSRHAVADAALVRHLRLTMLSFIEETLLRGGEGPSRR